VSQPPPGSLGAPFVGEALTFLKDPFTFTLSRTRQHGNIWKTRILSDTVVFFAGSQAFSFFMDPDHFTRQNGSPKFLQDLLHPDAVPFLDGDRHKTRKRLLLTAFTDQAMESYLPGVFTVIQRFVDNWVREGEKPVAGDLSQLGFDFALLIKGTFAPPINLPVTAYGKAIRARDRLRVYLKKRVAKDGKGSALGVLKGARGPNGEQLSTTELEIELLHFFFAAHGGLTAVFAWILTVLGERPELAAKIRAEADARLVAGKVPDLAQVRSLDLARAASREVLRSYPIAPVTFIGVAKKDLEFDGYLIRGGWKGAGAIWATLQDGTTFADPTAYKASRLDDGAVPALPKGAFVPLGGGPPDGHRCAGEALIQLLMPALFGWFTRNYELSYPQQDASPGGGGLGPLPKSGVRVKITRRAG